MFYIGFIFRKNKGKIGAILWEYWLSFEILHSIMWFLFYIGFIFRKNKGKINAILWESKRMLFLFWTFPFLMN
ncbi:hypothetical protein FLJC2902T_15070 [Flavobacterium limnosediminis JC2902]|uniref:Uncharacterized protein n=1 Tax=Flavobacterium limnosediminis JC2902 TaxID=1341181 RepID=V6SR24_9FLAO|nr:hypothetical protein FLJC2902T_15070 [Flavobacterium limnosediminis JC2902]